MNKEAVELIEQYINQTLTSNEGISPEAYNTLVSLLRVDKGLAQDLHTIVGSARKNNRDNFIYNENYNIGFEL